jgi:hypothetical protein
LLAGNKDFEALGSLAVALERIASVNVRQTTAQAKEVDLTVLLDELNQRARFPCSWLGSENLPWRRCGN